MNFQSWDACDKLIRTALKTQLKAWNIVLEKRGTEAAGLSFERYERRICSLNQLIRSAMVINQKEVVLARARAISLTSFGIFRGRSPTKATTFAGGLPRC